MHDVMIPPRKVPESDDDYLEEMTKAIFQSGFSWKVVDQKWPNFREAFEGFSVERVAEFDDRDLDKLLQDEGIVRNGRKIEATIKNAGEIRSILREHGSFRDYLRSMDGKGYRRVSDELQSRFSHLGRTGAYVFLWSVGEDVPDWEDR